MAPAHGINRTATRTATSFPRRSGCGIGLLSLAAFSIVTILAGQGLPPDALRNPRSGESAVTYETRGDKLMASHLFSQAVRDYRKAVDAAPALAVLHEKLGLALVGSGSMPAAIREFGEAVRLDRKSVV